MKTKCLRCGKCCKDLPCGVDEKIHDKVLKEFPEVQIFYPLVGMFGAAFKTDFEGKCVYYSEKDGKAICGMMEKSKSFKKWMIDGRALKNYCPKERLEN